MRDAIHRLTETLEQEQRWRQELQTKADERDAAVAESLRCRDEVRLLTSIFAVAQTPMRCVGL